MLDTLYPKWDDYFLMSRFLDPSFKTYALLDGPRVIYKNLKKATYSDFKIQFLSIVPTPKDFEIVHALRHNGYEHELKQYVIWQPPHSKFRAATLLNGDENFIIKG